MYKKLRGKIIAKYGDLGKFSDEIGLSKQAVSMKMNGKIRFSVDDIETWSEKLGIPKSKIWEYFLEKWFFLDIEFKKLNFMTKIKWDLVETIESKKMERKRKERLKEIERVRKMVYLLILAFFIYGLYNLVY